MYDNKQTVEFDIAVLWKENSYGLGEHYIPA